jgi:DNA-binding NarL/FixJ family response regulator
LRVEELQTLLSEHGDMKLLPPIADPDQALDVLSRMKEISHIDVVILEWEFGDQTHDQLLQTLCRYLRCLIIAPLLSPNETKRLEEAGAYGYCPTAASSHQLVKTIRTIARGKKSFHRMASSEQQPPLFVKRQPVFFQERLQELAASIHWPLSEIELLILSHFDGANNHEIARRIHRPEGTVRSVTSRIFFLLQQLSERQQIPNRLVAFQVLLELGVLEYR